MKRLLSAFLVVTGIIILSSWGFYGHRTINRLAVYTVPDPLMRLYKEHIDYLSTHAVDADKRRYSAPDEAPRHYLDADYYEQQLPIDTIPKYWKDAVVMYTEDTLKAYGIGPWHLENMVYQLTRAFEEKDLDRILRLSADIGHYAGDCHVPLHTTMNYDGQLSGQKGIHGFWESRLPELFASEYDFFVGKAQYLENVNAAVWEVFEASVAARDSVLRLEAELDRSFDPAKKYAFEERGQTNVKVYSYEYSKAYHELLDGMVERRMRAAIRFTGSLWYTAWVNAGSPDLDFKKEERLSDSLLPALVEQEKMLEFRKILGREEAK